MLDQVSRPVGPDDARELGGRLLGLLLGLDLACLGLHLAAGWVAAAQAGSSLSPAVALGNPDDGPLGLVGPVQLAALAAILVRAAWRRRSASFAGGAATVGLLAAGDLASLPARIGGRLAAELGLSTVVGSASAPLGKALAAAASGIAAVLLLARLAACRDPPARAVGGLLLRLVAGLAATLLVLDLPSSWMGTGSPAGVILACAEELTEAVLASWALVSCSLMLASAGWDGQEKYRIGTLVSARASPLASWSLVARLRN